MNAGEFRCCSVTKQTPVLGKSLSLRSSTLRNFYLFLLVIFVTIFSSPSFGQYISPAVDFFMHDRSYELYLRDHFRFDEPKPLRIEYFYNTWVNSKAGSEEYRDYLCLETSLPVYYGHTLSLEIPLQFIRTPFWSEKGDNTFGNRIDKIGSAFNAKWAISRRFKSVIGIEFRSQGGRDYFNKSEGRIVSPLKLLLSHDVHKHMNVVIGVRLDKYYYNTFSLSDRYKISERMYYQPIIMVNWHPSSKFTLLVGVPSYGALVDFGDTFKAEFRSSTDGWNEIAFRARPIEKTNIAFRFMQMPYEEVPVGVIDKGSGSSVLRRLAFKRTTLSIEAGRELNPAVVASLGFQYSRNGDPEFTDENGNKVNSLNSKDSLGIGFTFAVDIEALFQLK